MHFFPYTIPLWCVLPPHFPVCKFSLLGLAARLAGRLSRRCCSHKGTVVTGTGKPREHAFQVFTATNQQDHSEFTYAPTLVDSGVATYSVFIFIFEDFCSFKWTWAKPHSCSHSLTIVAVNVIAAKPNSQTGPGIVTYWQIQSLDQG